MELLQYCLIIGLLFVCLGNFSYCRRLKQQIQQKQHPVKGANRWQAKEFEWLDDRISAHRAAMDSIEDKLSKALMRGKKKQVNRLEEAFKWHQKKLAELRQEHKKLLQRISEPNQEEEDAATEAWAPKVPSDHPRDCRTTDV